MTDKEKFTALMKEFGVPLIETGREATETLSIEARQLPKIEGYEGFCAYFTFDAVTGSFISVGIWE